MNTELYYIGTRRAIFRKCNDAWRSPEDWLLLHLHRARWAAYLRSRRREMT